MKIGIDAISFYTSRYFLDLKTLAGVRNVEVDKYYLGIGQEKMAVPPPDEDVVTLAANAAQQVLAGVDLGSIDLLMFATESGIDQSKAAGIYVHQLLGLNPNCRVFELKQACYSGTAGLQMAAAMIAQHPTKKALVIATDIARYALASSGEPTQGAAAVAMLVSANPRILALEPEAGFYVKDVMDFWRPNYLSEALVDGKYSIKVYLESLAESWRHYGAISGRKFTDFNHFCYHLPFTRMAEKAHLHLVKSNPEITLSEEDAKKQIEKSLIYNRVIGNSYTGSLYIGFCSLLENSASDLAGERIGMFSYGSGCMGEFFSGVVQPGYQQHLLTEIHQRLLRERQELSYAQYEDFYHFSYPKDGGDYPFPRHATGGFRLAGIRNHQRIYERV